MHECHCLNPAHYFHFLACQHQGPSLFITISLGYLLSSVCGRLMVFSVLWPPGWHSFKQQVLFQVRGSGEGTQQPHSQFYRVTSGITFHYWWCAQQRNYFPIKTFKRICGLWGHGLAHRLELSISLHPDYLASCLDGTSHCLWGALQLEVWLLSAHLSGLRPSFSLPLSAVFLGTSEALPLLHFEMNLSFLILILLYWVPQQPPLVYLTWNTSDLSSPLFPLRDHLFHSNDSIKYATINRNLHLKQYRVFFFFSNFKF